MKSLSCQRSCRSSDGRVRGSKHKRTWATIPGHDGYLVTSKKGVKSTIRKGHSWGLPPINCWLQRIPKILKVIIGISRRRVNLKPSTAGCLMVCFAATLCEEFCGNGFPWMMDHRLHGFRNSKILLTYQLHQVAELPLPSFLSCQIQFFTTIWRFPEIGLPLVIIHF